MGKDVFCFAVPSYESPALAAAVEAIFEAGAAVRALGPGSRVVLKPNLLARHAPEKAVTTHPAVVDAVCAALARRGVRRITVADSPGGLYNAGVMRAIYKQSGLQAVCDRWGAEAYTGCEAVPCAAQGVRVRSFNLLRPVQEADLVINLPKYKTHVMTGLSCAVKNLFGTVPGLQKAEFHMRFPEREPFGEMLVDLCETVRPGLTIVDGVLAMEGDGPAGGAPRALGLVLGGEDPYSIDLAACRIMGLDPMQVPYLAAAHARGLCGAALDAAALRGEAAAAAPVQGYKLPASFAAVSFADKAPRALRWAVPGVERWLAPRPKVERKKCIGCGKCAEICPAHTIMLEDKKARIAPKACIRCFCCHEMCPVKAIEVKRAGIFDL